MAELILLLGLMVFVIITIIGKDLFSGIIAFLLGGGMIWSVYFASKIINYVLTKLTS